MIWQLVSTVTDGEVGPVLSSAKAISEYGILIVIAAFMLVFMFWMLKHFLTMFQDMFEKMTAAQNSEGGMEQVRVLQSISFDLSKYNVLEELERIFKEDNFDNRERVEQKIVDALKIIHNERNSQFDNFTYHGIKLSVFCDKEWIDKIKAVCLEQLYLNTESFDSHTAFAALDIAYNKIKIAFYNNVISKS